MTRSSDGKNELQSVQLADLQDLLRQAEHEERLGRYRESEALANQVLEGLDLKNSGISGTSFSHSQSLLADATRLLGILSWRRGQYDKAMEYLNNALEWSCEQNDRAGEANTLGCIGNVARSASNYPKAIECFQQALKINEESGNKLEIAKDLGSLGIVYQRLSDYTQAQEHYLRALHLFQEIEYASGIAASYSNLGTVCRQLSDYPKAFEYLNMALSIEEECGNKAGIALQLGNIGNVYNNISEYTKALECLNRALNLYIEIGSREGELTQLGNIGNNYSALSDYSTALEYYGKALNISKEIGDKNGVAVWLGNIGSVYTKLENQDIALEYFEKSRDIAEELGNKSLLATNLGRIGTLYKNIRDFPHALDCFRKAQSLDEELQNTAEAAIRLVNIGALYYDLDNISLASDHVLRALKHFDDAGMIAESAETRGYLGELLAHPGWEGYNETKAEEIMLSSIASINKLENQKFEVYGTLAELYKRQKRWQESLQYYEKYHELKDAAQSTEAKRTAALMEQRQQLADKERELAFAKAQGAAELSVTRRLLDAVLPTSIATRIIDGEKRIADFYPAISILFADIVGFTSIATEVPPDVVIDFLNHVFDVYDEIIKRHGCEKIKTIGDGYMAIAGAPTSCEDHAERIARAAVEMQKDILLPQDIRDYLPKDAVFNIRIGIHTGAAVCGVIGKERFVWDVYSDAVNIAARMESSGVAGKIQVSKDFAWLLRSRQKMMKCAEEFVLEERGEVEIKGKGLMRTYFLERL